MIKPGLFYQYGMLKCFDFAIRILEITLAWSQKPHETNSITSPDYNLGVSSEKKTIQMTNLHSRSRLV